MTPQEIFNFSVNHMREQGVPSKDPHDGMCLYLDDEGKSCAVGCFIEDPELAHEMDENPEGSTIDELIKEPYFRRKLPDWMASNTDLLISLQELHDTHLGYPSFESRLRVFADYYKLEVPK